MCGLLAFALVGVFALSLALSASDPLSGGLTSLLTMGTGLGAAVIRVITRELQGPEVSPAVS